MNTKGQYTYSVNNRQGSYSQSQQPFSPSDARQSSADSGYSGQVTYSGFTLNPHDPTRQHMPYVPGNPSNPDHTRRVDFLPPGAVAPATRPQLYPTIPPYAAPPSPYPGINDQAELDSSRIMPSSSRPYSSSEDGSSFTFTVRLAPSNTGSDAESTTAGSTETTSSNDHSLATFNSGFPVASATTHIATSSSDTVLLTSEPGFVRIASQKRAVDEELMEAVSYHDFERVEDCLNRGADPSYRHSTDQDDPNGFIQPITPLRLVMFRISDCLLNDEDLKEFYKIARCLLDHGADPKPAIKIAEERYGKYEDNSEGENDLFMDIWSIVHNAGTQ